MKFLLCALVVAACGGASPSTTTSTTPSALPSASAATAIVPMRATFPHVEAPVELRADGSIVAGGETIGKIVGMDVKDAGGTTVISVDATGRLTGEKSGKFDDQNDLVKDGNAEIMHIADDGAVSFLRADRTLDDQAPKITISGFVPSARRTAAMFVLATIWHLNAAKKN
ncbi:MAG TPA: hypothetical protein VGH87_12560 [Polyangiaceae bacterium]|jgi:hypothetical protein